MSDNKEPKILKHMKGDTVTYNIDYLLNNLAREIYLLESFRRWRDRKEGDDRDGKRTQE